MNSNTNTPETIADICREMRAQIDCLATDPGYNHVRCRSAADWARRIEAAAKRIVITDNSETLRNALARIDELGDALSRAIEERDRLAECLREAIECVCAGCPRNPCESPCEVVAKCRAAFAKATGEGDAR